MLFVGDKVRTPHGEGYVEEVTTWRDRVLGMEDWEAREFAEQCRWECGPHYRERWGRAIVRVGGVGRLYRVQQLTVLEGRDGIGAR